VNATGHECNGAAPDGGEPPANVQVPAKVPEVRSGATVAQRRRREAALRLPPLADGYRDPLDRLAADTGRKAAR
jgi:hypothetical protein